MAFNSFLPLPYMLAFRSAPYKYTFQEWRNDVRNALLQMRMNDNKHAFYWYIHDHTDLLEHFKKYCKAPKLTSPSTKEQFLRKTWKELYEILH